jgi:hypothetical protein
MTSPTNPTYRDMAVRSDVKRESRQLPVVKSIVSTTASVPAAASGDPQDTPKGIIGAITIETTATGPPTRGTTREELATRGETIPPEEPSERGDRPWLDPASPEEEPNAPLSLPLEGPREPQRASGSTDNSDYKSAISVPVVKADDQCAAVGGNVIPSVTTEIVDGDESEPTAEDRALAKKIFDGNEEVISKARAATWLGDSGPAGARARKAYMELYDWTNMNILAAMRVLCGRLVLKGETQQVDRILGAISRRWCECNPKHGFKHTGKSTILWW